MLCEYSHTKSESLAQIHTTMAEIQHFFSRGLFLSVHPVVVVTTAISIIVNWSRQLAAVWLHVCDSHERWPCGYGYQSCLWLFSVCLSVRAVKGKWLKLLTPDLVDMQCVASAWHGLILKSKGQGHIGMKCAVSVGMHVSMTAYFFQYFCADVCLVIKDQYCTALLAYCWSGSCLIRMRITLHIHLCLWTFLFSCFSHCCNIFWCLSAAAWNLLKIVQFWAVIMAILSCAGSWA